MLNTQIVKLLDQSDLPMKQNYSFKILKYIYKELSITDHLETEYAISDNEDWKGEYNKLMTGFLALPKVQFYPKRNVVSDIMAYSAGSMA
ncbi:MAG: hypothetical protein P8M34_11665 [Saprospiraceae bacterium]|nr:hypothetical protein [Saprospiraceae bacterium]